MFDKKKFLHFLAILLITYMLPTPTAMSQTTKKATEGGYTYEYVENDPMKTRIYTLKNGLKAYLSVNEGEPRIQTAIPVRVGSKQDPRETTGLAHYLEHMLFKGTDQIGTTDWEKEQPYLAEITQLYEQHKQETEPDKRKAIYQKIDSVSYLASKLVASNEYDKMTSLLGAKGTNAFTSTDQTVYINDIPTNELEKWVRLESERFRKLVLRLFHTELEAVYEEFNMSQDNDGRKVYSTMLETMFPNHPYNISTIGLGEHLKSPSLVNIENFFNTYYVANNIAICLSGEFDPTTTIQLIDKYFGNLRSGEVPTWSPPKEASISQPIEKTVLGKEAESVNIYFRFPGAASHEVFMLQLLDKIFQNGQAGIMDLNLIQKQKILSGATFMSDMTDYSIYGLYGRPREGQSLEEVRDLLLSQIEALKRGEFEDWMLDAARKNLKLSQMKGLESNQNRTFTMVDAFINQRNWADVVEYLQKYDKITKSDIIAFANEHFKNNYLVLYKRNGEDPNIMKIQKPHITPVELNREIESNYMKTFKTLDSKQLQPVFLDFEHDIHKMKLKSGIELNYIKNELNPTFALYYIFDMGKNHDKKMDFAIKYLPYLGTDKYTADQLQQEFFKLGLTFDVFTSDTRSYVYLTGLEESLEKGVALFEHILAHVKPDVQVLGNLVADELKSRADAKKNRRQISNALYNYSKYGSQSPFTNILSEIELKSLKPEELVSLLKKLTSYQHYIFYYGSKPQKEAAVVLNKYHKTPKKLIPYPTPIKFVEQPTPTDQVLFVNYDNVQAQINMLSQDGAFNKELLPYESVFDEYFGGGLSSIVFQEIREKRALAYSSFASYSSANKADEKNYVVAFMAVQADKMTDAIGAMRGLLNDMPQAPIQFEAAKENVQKQIESERITKSRKFFTFLSNRDKGLNYDVKKDIYEKAKTMKIEDLAHFFDQHVKNKNYTFAVIGNRDILNLDTLRAIGNFRETSLEEIFGY